MNIDWFTFAAQVFNFLVLVVALKFLLYDRVLKAVRERRENIRSEFDEAERKAEQAESRREEYEKKIEEFEKEKERRRSELKSEIDEKREKMTGELRREIERKREDWMGSLVREKKSFLGDLRESAAGEIFLAARTMLRDLADEELERRIAERFAGMLEDLDEDSAGELAGALSGKGGALEVRSSFELSGGMRERITEAAGRALDMEPEVDFKEDGGLVCGVAMRAGGVEVSWNVQDYLGDLEDRTGEKIDEKVRSSDAEGDGDERQ